MTKITKFIKPPKSNDIGKAKADTTELESEVKAAIEKFESKNNGVEVSFLLTTRTKPYGVVIYPFLNGTQS